MTRIQIELSDDLYERVERFARERKVSRSEMTHRGLELLLTQFNDPSAVTAEWRLPVVWAGGINVPLAKLREIGAADEETRAIRA